MADKPTQKHRELAISDKPLGEDVLLLISVSGTEQLGRLFEYRLELASEDHQIAPEKIIGQNVTIRFELGTGKTRYFNGYVSHFTQLTASGRLARYRATVVPWFWFLTRVADCRIFQEKTIPDIIEQIFRDRGFTDYDKRLSCEYRKWEYCVQYRETDFNFISRLMEQEGIYYYFEHENGKHSLVIADSNSAHKPYPDFKKLIYHPSDKGPTTEECVSDWFVETHLQPGKYAINDFSFKNPQTPLLVREKASGSGEQGSSKNSYEIYDYPGDYTTYNDGTEYAKKRIEELQAQYKVAIANSDSRGICSGYLFELSNHHIDDQNGEYLITSANFNIKGDEIFSAGGASSECVFSCSFTAIKNSKPFRSPRITPKPTISGPQTAFVTGKSADEIYTDKFGRVKVKFHWDQHNKADENSSCWIRVAQVWAGRKWGAMYIPRIGQEVIVEFLEGNPDRPIITGRVYNAKAMPPYDLPDKKTMSTLKSNSSKGGEGFNEIRFDDEKGKEQIFIHGEKNLDIHVKNDRFETIKNNRHLVVENEKFEQIKNNRNETVDADHKEEIGGDRNLKVKGKEAKEVGKSLSLTVKGDVIEVFKGKHSEQTTKDYFLKAQNIVIEAMQNITLRVGGSHIAIEAGTIEIQTGGQVKVQGKQVSVNGDLITEVKGGTVKIN
jgi:type VI secretion system secreted protein VgrG